ncbi:MAG: hypothetical protein JF614_26695 [Acidobacteria bacterium]|nr:hypothetical protein [Acidobacteriota bacterium]
MEDVGRRVVSMPALEPHAGQQSDLDYVLRAHVAPGYLTPADLPTRHDFDADFASDACIYGQGVDPETGGRHLEEIASRSSRSSASGTRQRRPCTCTGEECGGSSRS